MFGYIMKLVSAMLAGIGLAFVLVFLSVAVVLNTGDVETAKNILTFSFPAVFMFGGYIGLIVGAFF